jgi:hypothetical protein
MEDNTRDSKLKRNRYMRSYKKSLRCAVLAFLGNRCSNSNCRWLNLDGSLGCTDPDLLQVDHVNGGGTKEREHLTSCTIYTRILKGTPGYQLLCANCNWKKRYENKEHKKQETYNG